MAAAGGEDQAMAAPGGSFSPELAQVFFHVTLTVESDISFTVEDDPPPLAGTDGRPQPGFDGSLIGRRRFQLAATAALCTHVGIEVRTARRAWRQEFPIPESPSAIICRGPSEVVATWAAFTFDSAYFAPAVPYPPTRPSSEKTQRESRCQELLRSLTCDALDHGREYAQRAMTVTSGNSRSANGGDQRLRLA
jgi:hypothetical protein